nr:hypothetical protein BaRGS_021633 [Batillaria attramentaria]
MSHTSSPDNSRTHNLTGAPEPPGAASAKGHGAFSQKESGVNLSPSQSQKGFVTTDNHHYNHAYPDNHLAINMNRMPSYSPQPADAQQQRDSITPSPIDYFPQGQPLPAPFRLQQAYDRQNMGQAEKKKIARLSECYPTREVTQKDDDSLPTADPAKLAALEQFDRLNMGQTEEQLQKGHDLDSADLQSDPKKLAALKQFDSQNQSPPSANQQEGGQDRGERGGTSEGELSCDPKKLAYLRQFDEHNVGGGCHAMLARQRNFFQMYEQAMQGMNSDDDYPEEDDKLEGEDDEDADGDDDNNVDSSVGMEEEMREGVTVQQGSLVTVKETVPQSVHHRDPSEQDEESNINLDYFKERAQYYGKAFKKTPYAAHC